MMKDKYDIIVVGAGLAGLTAAYVLARNGFDVIVLERGNCCGEKNVSGGVFLGTSFQDVFSEVASQAPFERRIRRRMLACVSGDAVISYDYYSDANDRGMGFSVLRAKFDKWLAERVSEAGAEIVCGVTVDSIVFDHDVVKGIAVNGENLYSDVVILAEGANAVLTEKAGLRDRLRPSQAGLGIKEVISLGEETINERFNVDSEEGAAIQLFGTITEQIEGGGFIYTNKDTVSLGLVFALSSYRESNNPPYEIIEQFKGIPYVAKLIEGGETVEYSAHLVPETGPETTPRIYGNGILVAGDAAGFSLKNGRTVEGMNYAVESGKLAAETILQAVQFNDFSAEVLSEYEKKIADNKLFRRLEKFRETYKFFKNPRLYAEYPELVHDFSRKLFAEGEQSDERILSLLLESTRSSDLTVRNVLWDMIRSQRLL